MGKKEPKGVFIRNGIYKNSDNVLGRLMQEALDEHDDIQSLFSSDLFVPIGGVTKF